jgi:AbrB family looped-hinge helix DNA binding protein
METVTLSSKGQLVIPSQVRAAADLHAGDMFEVRYLDGEIRLRPVALARATTLDDVAGCLAVAKKGLSLSPPLSDVQVNASIKARLKAEDTATMSPLVKPRKSAA